MSNEAREPSAKYLAMKGYKQTELGQLPDDWDVESLGQRATFRTGPFGSALHKSDYINDGIPIINPMHIVDGLISPTTGMTISDQAANRLSDFCVKPGEIVIGRRGDMGRCAVVRDTEAGWLCGTGSMIIRPGKINSNFLQRVISSPKVIRAIEDAAVGTTMVNLNQGTLSGLKIQFPPWHEQDAIASALSDVDALITGLERLTAKKRDIKQAAMQQLLTGQTRLPGFSRKWEIRQLGQLGIFLKGSGVKRDQALSGDLACIRYGEIYTVHNDVVRAFHSRISPQVAATATRIQAGDLLFAGSGETKAEIGKCVAITSPAEAYAGGDIVILRLRTGDPAFFGYRLNTPSVVRQKANLGQGDAVVHISASALANVEAEVPTLEEQTAIATVLSDMDSDLFTLESRLTKTWAIKQGMMQELLTGRIRLK